MFGSTVLDIVIGMVFVYLLLSLICSALNELIETVFKNRARDLERGMREFVADPATAPQFLSALYNHGLINSLFKGTYPPERKADLPSYIPASAFALAVMDLVRNPPTAAFRLPPNLKSAVTIFERQAGGDAAKVQANLEEWFDHRMDRVAGWYKRRVQWILVALGLVVAVAINADSIKIARSLSNDASLRSGLVASIQAHGAPPPLSATGAADPAPGTTAANEQSASAAIVNSITQLDSLGLPIGWHKKDLQDADKAPGSGWVKRSAAIVGVLGATHLLGWLLTAIAISMGAPFWFDLLNRFIAVRSTLKPAPADGAAPAATLPQPIALTLSAPPPAPLALPSGSAAPPPPGELPPGDAGPPSEP